MLAVANKFSGSSVHGNLTRGGAVFFDGWLLINQAETGAYTRECTRMARVCGGARGCAGVHATGYSLVRPAGISASYSICGRFAPARPGQMISRWGCSPSLSGRRCRTHRDIRSTVSTLSERKRYPRLTWSSRGMVHNGQTDQLRVAHSDRYTYVSLHHGLPRSLIKKFIFSMWHPDTLALSNQTLLSLRDVYVGCSD